MSTTGAAPRRGALAAAVLGLALAGTLAAACTAPGQDAVTAADAFLEYYAGVLTLVTLTGAVFFGTVAALRMLPPGPRVVVQALHRSAAVTAVGFLVTHALLKVMEAHAKPLDLVVPTSPSWVALGTISGDLLILAAASGAVRGRYAATVRPWAWRALHCTVYVTWPIAVAHGLLAGRAPRPWVTIGYLACAAAVIGILLLRSATTSRREPPGSVPLSDLSDLSGPRRGDAEPSGPRTGSFMAEPPLDGGARTTGLACGTPRSGVHRAGPHAAGRTGEPSRADGGRSGARTASFADDLAREAGGRAGSASFVDEPLDAAGQARLRAASGTASYVDGPGRAADATGSRTTGLFGAAGPPPTPQAPASEPFSTAPSSGPFPAANRSGAGPEPGDRLVAGSFGDRVWPPPPPPPPASIADLIGAPSADPGGGPRTASGTPAPPRRDDVLSGASPAPATPAGGPEPSGFARPAAPPHAGAQARAEASGTRGPAEPSAARARTAPAGPDAVRVATGPRDVREPHRGPDPVRTPRRASEPAPGPRGRKGKKGRHQTRSIDEQDAAFWASLRAERPDWTRP